MTDSPHLVAKYQAILDSNGQGGPDNAVSSVIVDVPAHLQGQSGSISTYVTLQLANGQKIELFVKNAPENPGLVVSTVCGKETGFFNHVLPDFQKLYIAKGLEGVIRPLTFVPKCYFADSKQIVLENLVASKGYYMQRSEDGRDRRQELHQTKMVLPDLATFHALSYCIMEEMGESAFLEKYPFVKGGGIYSSENVYLSSMVELAVNVCEELLVKNELPDGDRALETIRKYKGRVFPVLLDLIDPDTSSHLFKVLNHGDVKNDNMLFLKNSDSGELEHSVIVDYQTLRCGSPNLDLTYYFFSSLPFETRKQHWLQLLADYFHVFTKTVQSITEANNNNEKGAGPEFQHTFEQFVQDFKAKSFIGFWFNIMYWLGEELAGKFDLITVEGDMITCFTNRAHAWLAANSDKRMEMAKELVKFCDEFAEVNFVK